MSGKQHVSPSNFLYHNTEEGVKIEKGTQQKGDKIRHQQIKEQFFKEWQKNCQFERVTLQTSDITSMLDGLITSSSRRKWIKSENHYGGPWVSKYQC